MHLSLALIPIAYWISPGNQAAGTAQAGMGLAALPVAQSRSPGLLAAAQAQEAAFLAVMAQAARLFLELILGLILARLPVAAQATRGLVLPARFPHWCLERL